LCPLAFAGNIGRKPSPLRGRVGRGCRTFEIVLGS